MRMSITPLGAGRWLAQIVLLALAYYVSGRLGMLLAIPPGYATAVFPPSGIALAALLWGGVWLTPGVWLGSCAMNLWITFSGNPQLTLLQALPLAGTIAVGSTAQALAGYGLITRLLPPQTDREPDPIRFLLLGGPIACLISATVGTASLATVGAIPWSELPFNWFTWWVGDTIGVITLTPLVLILIGRGRYTWSRRRLTVALPLAATFATAVMIFVRVSGWGNDAIATSFNDQVNRLRDGVEKQFTLKTDAVLQIESFYRSSNTVTRDEFHRFVQQALVRSPDIQALEWVERVPQTERATFEARLRAEGHSDFQIGEIGPNGEIQRDRPRADHYVVTYVEPFVPNQRAFGVDLGSSPARLTVMSQARDSGEPTASPPVELVQGGGHYGGLLLFVPIYRNAPLPTTLAERRAALIGFALAVLRIEDLLQTVLASRPMDTLRVRVRDLDAPPAQNLLFDSHPREPWQVSAMALIARQALNFGGRRYQVEFLPTQQFLGGHRSWQAWLVLAGGLLFSAILGAFLLVLTGHTTRVEAEVAQRTQELRWAEQSARERESRLESILAQAIDAILICNESGTVLRANAAAGHLFDQSPAALAQCQLTRLIHHANGAPLAASIVDLYRYLDDSRTGEAWVAFAQQVPIPVEYSLSQVQLDHDVNYTVILRDVRERKRVERMKHELVATVSHELRTPLTAIRGSLGLLTGGALGELPAAVHELVILAQRNSERLVLLINDLLDLERLELGTLTLQPRPTDVDAIVTQAVAANRPYGDQYGVQLVVNHLSPVPCQALVDPARLIQVLTNLISNAVKFSPEHGTVTLTVAHSINARRLRVSVQDQGPGVPLEFQSRIFQPFAQADTSDSRAGAGAGLGLSISKRLIERMEGVIGFHSSTAGGATFFIELPCLAPTTAGSDSVNYTSDQTPAAAAPRTDPPSAQETPE